MKTLLLVSLSTLVGSSLVLGQGAAPFGNSQPSTAPPGPTTSTPAAGNAKKPKQFLGGDLPMFDPGSELLSWDGKSWNVNDNRLFEARFEKYLNAEEATAEVDRQYRAIIAGILNRLAPGRATTANVDEAFRLLPKASDFEIDARLCDSIADAVYSAWRAQGTNARLTQANEALEKERKTHEWNAMMSAKEVGGKEAPPGNKEAAKAWEKARNAERDLRMQQYTTRLSEVMAMIKANQAKKVASQLQTKIEFQSLIVQLFLQRRFQHVLMATRFYRAVFAGGDTKLELGKDSKDLFANSVGMPPTVGTLDAMANEAIRDAREGVEAYKFLVGNNELESATKRLAEAFVIGEYLPELRTLPRTEKRQALEFVQLSNQLISAITVKDYTLAEKNVKRLEKIAKDFDNSKPMAAIETAKTVSAMHLAKAKNAAVGGDEETLEVELKAATEVWPRNPALAEVSGLIFSQADVQQKALVDLDQLISQKNYRQIYDDKVRFIAATALYPEKQEQLAKVLEDMQTIESAIIRANEIARNGNYPGAWESVETVFAQFPNDRKLNQVRANLTTNAADFVRTLRTAENLEQKGQIGSSLAWFLKARSLYPDSTMANAGVERLVKEVLTET